MEKNQDKKEIIDALHVVISELDENPIADIRANDVIIEILSARIEHYICA